MQHELKKLHQNNKSKYFEISEPIIDQDFGRVIIGSKNYWSNFRPIAIGLNYTKDFEGIQKPKAKVERPDWVVRFGFGLFRFLGVFLNLSHF